MKKFLSIITLLAMAIISIVYFRIRNVEDNEKEKRKEEAVGTYELNLQESLLGNYIKDSTLLRNLKLNLNADNTFIFSQSTPFIYDSSGIWRVASVGIYGNNELVYGNKFSNQISPCCYKNKIQMKLPLSKKGFEQVKLLVFTKIND
jgi:hypothetical protein